MWPLRALYNDATPSLVVSLDYFCAEPRARKKASGRLCAPPRRGWGLAPPPCGGLVV